MKARFGLAFSLAMSFAGAAAAQTTLLFDNFDSYTDQANFQATWGPSVSAIDNATVVPSELLLTAADTGGNPTPLSGVNMVGLPTTQNRNQRTITATGVPSLTNVISFSYDFYDSNAAASPYRQSSTLQTAVANATNQLVAIGLSNNQASSAAGGNFYFARILGYNPDLNTVDPDGGPKETGIPALPTNSPYFKLNDFANSPLRTTGWHNLRVDISSDDGVGTDYTFYVDSILAEKVSNIGTAASLRTYDTIRLGSGLTSVTAAYVDNMSVVLNPVVAPVFNSDFNNDGKVDGADFLTWQKGLGLTGQTTKATGDATGEGTVDSADLSIWQAKFGTAGSAAAVTAIPEPASALLSALPLVGAATLRRRK